MTKHQSMRNWLIIILCSFFFLFYKLGDAPLWERDEPKYAEPGWKMAVTGDWLTPRFNGALRFDKPPLFYWLEGVSFKIFGKTEFAARFPSALAGVGIALLTYALGKKITNPTKALLSTIILVISPHFLLQSRLSVVDAVLTFFLTLSFYSIYELGLNKTEKKQSPFIYLYLAVFAIAMATLTKGPIGIIFPFAIAVAWRFIAQDIKYDLPLRHWIGALILFLILVLPWYIAISKTHEKSYFDSFFLFHNVTRFLQPVDSHKGPVWFYLPIIIAGFFPWSFFIFHFFKAGKKELPKSNFLFLVIWSAIIVVFFTIAKTKLGSYIFPAYPALAILSGSYLGSFFDKTRRLQYTIPYGIFIFIAALFWAAGLFYLPYLVKHAGIQEYAVTILRPICVLLAFGFLIASVLAALTGTQKFSFCALFLTMGIFFWLVMTYLLPVAAKENPEKEIANKLISSGLSKDDRIVLYNTILNGLVFYADHEVQFIAGNRELPQFKMERNVRTFLVFHKKDLHLFQKDILNSNWQLLHTANNLLVYAN